LGRRDAGILDPGETDPVAQAVEAVLGADTLAGLAGIWRAAFEVDDDQAEAMLDLGRRWCDVLGIDPTGPAPTDPAPTGHPGTGTGSSTGTAGGAAVAEAVEAALNRVAAAVASEPAPTDPAAQALARAAAAAATEQQARTGAAAAARAVFGTGRAGAGRPPVGGTRAPTPTEQAAARTLARLLGTAGVRERATVKTTSPVPPGRLRMRGALAADAQRAAGAIATAEPFTRATRRATPTPPLRVGIACDVSGSMAEFTGPVASAAWIVATAAARTPVPALTATVIFGSTVRPITHPGTAPAKVTTFPAIACAHDIGLAIDALDGALDLARPGAARLLVIVSDGYYDPTDRAAGQRRIDRLRATGCAVLWLAPEDADPLDGATVHPLADPATTAPAIGRAAITALRATH
jgi:uncharacterized protein with von Willebrand factor type A (vWA) domain